MNSWYLKNKKRANASSVRSARKARLKNPEKYRSQQRAYHNRHPEAKLYYGARYRAKKLGLPFLIERADIVIPEQCPVLGISISRGREKLHDGSPTIDRLVAAVGYVRGNIHVISHRANRLKQDATTDELERILRWIRSHS